MDVRRRNFARAMLPLFVVAAVAFWLLFFPALDLTRIQAWINGFGFWGPVVFLLFYILAVMILVPGWVLALAAGLSYGMPGLPLALVGAATGASFSFLIARYLAHSQVQVLTSRHLLCQAVEHAISDGGWRIVVLMRLSPMLPFNLQNYFFGITRIPFRHYLSGTFFGIIPGITVDVSFATVGQTVTPERLWHPVNAGLFLIGLIVTVAMGLLINRRVHALLVS